LAQSERYGKMVTTFKNGEFDVFLEQFSEMIEKEFIDTEFIKASSVKLEI
jgi:hypothetical protein